MRPALHAASAALLLAAAVASAQMPNPAVYTFTVAGVRPGICQDGATLNGTWRLVQTDATTYRTGVRLPTDPPQPTVLVTQESTFTPRPPSVNLFWPWALQKQRDGSVLLSVGPLTYRAPGPWDGLAPLTLTLVPPAAQAVTNPPATLTVTRVP